jgi:hypothetical protein
MAKLRDRLDSADELRRIFRESIYGPSGSLRLLYSFETWLEAGLPLFLDESVTDTAIVEAERARRFPPGPPEPPRFVIGADGYLPGVGRVENSSARIPGYWEAQGDGSTRPAANAAEIAAEYNARP